MNADVPSSTSLPVGDYAAAVASAAPTPGGGSVAGTTGALAAALAEMVCRLTLAGKNPPAHPESLESTAAHAATLRDRLLSLAAQDEAAYAAYRAAVALPRSSEPEQLARRAALDNAIIVAADVPLATARACIDVLDALIIAAEHGTKHALSDVSTGSLLAGAAGRSALLNVRVNAGIMKQPDLAARYEADASAVEALIIDRTETALAAVAQRLS